MKPLIALLVATMLGVGLCACGGSSKGSGSTLSTATEASSIPPALRGLRGDEDDDESGENVGNTSDGDADFDNDSKSKNSGYYDSDDGGIRAYGHAASATQSQQLTAVVKRYYAAAAAGDGPAACSLIDPSFVKAIPEDYGSGAGPAYLRGKTCPAVMSLLFRHDHRALVGETIIVGVRVKGNQAYVLVGSKNRPASYVTLQRERNAWRVDGLLGTPFP